MIYIGIIIGVLLASSAAIIIITRKQTVLLEKFHTFEASLKSSTNSVRTLTKELTSLKQAQRAQNFIAKDAAAATENGNNRQIINKDMIKELLLNLEEEGILSRDKRRMAKEIIIVQEYIHHCGNDELSVEEEMEVILDEARELIQITGVASAKLLKEKLRISQDTAQTILNRLEEEGIVGPSDGTSHRNVFKRE